MDSSLFLEMFLIGLFGGAIFECIKKIIGERKFYTILILLIFGTTLVDLYDQGLKSFNSRIDGIICWEGLFIIIGMFPGLFIGRRLASYYKTGELFESE